MGRKHRLIFTVTLFYSALLCTVVMAQTSENLACIREYYHDWRDGSYDVATQNGYAYLACGQEGVHVLDISNLDNIRDVARLADIHATTVAVRDQKLYLGNNYDGVYRFDISDPLHPIGEARIPTPDRIINSLRIQGPYLCVCGFSNSGAGLTFIGIGTGTEFYPLWSSQAIENASDIEIQGALAYVGTDTKLLMLSIADITSPQAVDSILFAYSQPVLGVAVSGTYAYLANGDGGFRIVNLISHETVAQITDLDPNVPTDIDYPIAVRLVGNTAYVHYNIYDCPLAIIDICDPLNPVIQSNYYPPDNISKFVIEGSNAFIADLTGGLRVLDLTDSYHPVDAYHFDDYDRDLKIVGVSGDIAYVQQKHRVVAMDLSDPREPRERGTIGWDMSPQSPYWADEIRQFEISGSVGYCLNGIRLYTLDLSDPDRITVLDSMDGTDYYFIHSGPYIYLPVDDGFEVINAWDPADLLPEGQIPRPVFSRATEGHLFHYMQAGVALCAFEDVPSPRWQGPFPPVMEYTADYAAKIDGDKLYLAAWNAVAIYSLTDPSLHASFPVVETGDWSQWITDLEVVDGIAYVSVFNGGIEVYDVRNPQAVQRIGYYEAPLHATSLLVQGSLVYVAAESHLGVYEFTGALSRDAERELQPQTCVLEPNYPNPFNPTTTIAFDLPASGPMSLTIFNTLGQKVATLAEGFHAAGHYQLQWNAANVASGVYVYRLQSGQTVLNRSMTLVR